MNGELGFEPHLKTLGDEIGHVDLMEHDIVREMSKVKLMTKSVSGSDR